MYSTNNGQTWTAGTAQTGNWVSVIYGNGRFVAVGLVVEVMYSTNGGSTWTLGTAQPGQWAGVAYGNGVFVAVNRASFGLTTQMISSDGGQTWAYASNPSSFGQYAITFSGDRFVSVGLYSASYSFDGDTWYETFNIPSSLYAWSSVTYGNGTFVATSASGLVMYSFDGVDWTRSANPQPGVWEGLTFGTGQIQYVSSSSDSASLFQQPIDITYNTSNVNFVFYSNVYSGIQFENAESAAFWGFDSRQGLTYTFKNEYITPPWQLPQSGWIGGFLPPSASVYDDSVAHKMCKAVRIMCGKQTIKEYTGEYIELHNDLMVDYANKAILKLMNGTLDQTQATISREYYVSLPLGAKEIPLCALTHQNMSVEIDFENYTNLSIDLNPGSGNFNDPDSYRMYNASAGILNGAPLNVIETFSYQQYIFILNSDGKLIIFNTTLNVDDPGSYQIVNASSSQFSRFFAFGNTLYIQLVNGHLGKYQISDLLNGYTSLFTENNYLPDIPAELGLPTGTLVADARYLYYAQSNASASNVYFTRYDTQGSFTSSSSYLSFDFTSNINSSVSSIYQTLSTGSQLIMIPNTSGRLFTFNLNANFLTQWYNNIDYAPYGTQVTEGVQIGDVTYFVLDNFKILKYTNGVLLVYSSGLSVGTGLKNLLPYENYIYASSNSSTISSVIRINTAGDLSNPTAYEYYTSKTTPPVITFDGTSPKIFANGPRYIYFFSSGSSTATNVFEFDSYPKTPVLKASIIVDYESLPPEVPKPDKALIGFVQTQKVTNMDVMDLHGPVKELWITGASSTTNVFQYSNLSNQVTLTFTAGEEMITPDTGTRKMLSVIQPFEMHTSMPIRNVSTFSFEMDPESSTPNGTVNFSRIYEQALTANAATVWARNYNILAIQGGICGLMFN
jgi:hypothetical protein